MNLSAYVNIIISRREKRDQNKEIERQNKKENGEVS